MNSEVVPEAPVALAPSTEWSSCPVCASTARAPWVSFSELEFVECGSCRTVYKSREVPLRTDDFYEASYFSGRKSGREKRFEHRVRKAQRWLESTLRFGNARSVLDIGCSLGYVVEAGKRLGLDAAGTDVSEYAVKVCRERGLRAEVGTLDKLPFKDSEFDLIVMKHVLEHTPNPKVALAEVRRILSPNGMVLIAVPDLEYWKGLFLRRSYRYFRPDDLGQQHYVYYRQGSLAELLDRNGFNVIAQSKAQARPGNVAVALWQATARALRMRRELYFLAKQRS